MSELVRLSLAPDFRAVISALVPGVTAEDFDRLGQMMAQDRFVTDDLGAHSAVAVWVAEITVRRNGPEPEAAPALPRPAPVTGSAGAVQG